jgi:hypothetical protein
MYFEHAMDDRECRRALAAGSICTLALARLSSLSIFQFSLVSHFPQQGFPQEKGLNPSSATSMASRLFI